MDVLSRILSFSCYDVSRGFQTFPYKITRNLIFLPKDFFFRYVHQFNHKKWFLRCKLLRYDSLIIPYYICGKILLDVLPKLVWLCIGRGPVVLLGVANVSRVNDRQSDRLFFKSKNHIQTTLAQWRKKKNPATDASHLKARRDDLVFGWSWRGDETIYSFGNSEETTFRSQVFTILEWWRNDLYFGYSSGITRLY